MQMTFVQFCDKEMLSGKDRQAFKAWLGDKANIRMSNKEWWKLFFEWVKSK